MSSIDERIVSMQFDNRQFETNVATSINTLNGLKKGLDLSESAKGLESINDAASKVNLSGISSGVETIRVGFSALQVTAVTVLANITNSVINTGKNIVSSLTIDPVKDGFKEYETQMNSIQTILANTSAKGTTLDQVKAALQDLNTYSDKTIYNFTEMARNIGTFTAAGVDLDKSTTAIKGIANLAAVSGSNSEQASTAMYQLSQALAAGTVKLQDWNSVVNAGMGGEVFQKALIETAKVHGVAIDEMIKSEGSFRETLQKGWLTSDILTETLSKFTGDLNEDQLKTMGYTDDQIAGIIKMGQTANDAATKVKTISQLMDTLKEAVGSGWAQTWQTVFGDFDEAKTLFTNVSNVLGGMITQSSNARNELLKGWADLGGRTVLIQAIGDAFNNVMSVVNAIGKAFRDIFPTTTSEQLLGFTQGLKNLIDNLTMSDSTLQKLESTFKGIFAILDIAKTVLSAVANAIFILLGGVGSLGSSLLGVTGSIGEWLAALDNAIKQSDIFNKVLTTLAYGIKNGFNGIAYIFDSIVKSIGTVVTAIGASIKFPGFEGLQTFLEALGKRMSSIGDEASTMSNTVGGAFTSMGKSITDSKIGELFESLYKTVKTIAGAIGTLVGKMADTISNSLNNANFSGIFDAIASVSIGGIALAITKFLKSVSEPLYGLQGMLDGVTGILDGVRGSFEAYQTQLKAGTLLKIATAIGILAASILTISLIDSAKLASSLAAIGGLFTELLAGMFVFTKIGDLKGASLKANAVMLSMSTSILILSSAMKNLAQLDWNGIAKGTVGIAALSATMVASAKVLSSDGGTIVKGSLGMVTFAAAIKVLASACSDLAKLSWNDMTKGLVGVAGLMATVSLFLNNTTFSAKSALTATGILLLSGAIKILASACSDFAGMSWEGIGKGLTSVGVLLTELSLFSNTTANAKNVISTGIALVAIGESMKLLADAMTTLGNISWEGIGKGLISIGVALTEITVAVQLMPSNLPIVATGLVLVGAALNIIANALQNMGSMSWDSITKGLVTLGTSLGLLAIGLNTMTGSLSGSAALLVAAGALAILAPALSLLGAMTWDSIIKGLTDLGATIAIFGVSAAVLTPVIPSMIGLAGALALLGVSMLGIGAGLALVGVGIAGVSAGLAALAGVTAAGATAIVASLGVIVTGIAALIPAIMGKIGEGIVSFIQVFTDGIPAILQCVTTIITAIVGCIVTNTPTIVNGVMQTLSSILSALTQWVPTILQQVADLLLAILKSIADNISQFVQAGVDIITGFLNGIANSLPSVIQSAFNVIISFINGLADAIRNNSASIADACLNLVDAIVDGIGTLGSKFIDAGANAVQGFVDGLLSIPGKIWDAGVSIGEKALDAAKEALDIHSPSRKFGTLGQFSTLGYINGLLKYKDKVGDTSTEVANTAMDSMTNAISGISDMVNDNMDSQPVITPVLDLSNIQNGSNQLYSMMDEVGNYGIGVSANNASSVAKSIQNSNNTNNASDSTNTNNSQSSDNSNNSNIPKKPITLQLVLQNGKAIAEYIIDDVDTLMGAKNKITGRKVGV